MSLVGVISAVTHWYRFLVPLCNKIWRVWEEIIIFLTVRAVVWPWLNWSGKWRTVWQEGSSCCVSKVRQLFPSSLSPKVWICFAAKYWTVVCYCCPSENYVNSKQIWAHAECIPMAAKCHEEVCPTNTHLTLLRLAESQASLCESRTWLICLYCNTTGQ